MTTVYRAYIEHDGLDAASMDGAALQLRDGGLVISGQSPDGELTEFVELPREVHPFYVATQAHPEFKSRPTKPHPLFAGLVKAALEHKEERLHIAQ